MDENVRQVVREAIVELIQDTVAEGNVAKAIALHSSKIHFVPAKYRVLGGLLQSLNIKFGNFIEKLIALVVERDSKVTSLPASGKKITFSMAPETDALIDRYVTQRQLPDSPDECDDLFNKLLDTIIRIENNTPAQDKNQIRKDVDVLFKSAKGQIVYLEIKYNDDHDTGKFVDINRKFIKTYAGLVNHQNVTKLDQLKPILYYLNPTKRWGPIYTPTANIYRGKQLFEEFFDTNFDDINTYLTHIGDDPEILAIFDDLYKKIRYGDSPARLL